MEQFQATFHLRTPSNETWEVLVKAGLGVSIIDKGLSEFMDYHKVELNYKLIFTFNPPYEFKVVILNSGGREIYYPKRMQEQNIGLTNVYQNTMHANLNTDVHENELIRNCLNDLYYRVDHLVSQNHVNPSQWSFKFVCKNYDWKYKVDIPALEAVQFIGRDRTTIIVWKLPKPGRRLDHPMPFKLGYVCTEETSRRGKKPKLKARIAKGWRIPNHVTHLLGDLNFDTITLFVKGMEGHSWQVAVVVDEKDGNLYFTDGVDELIKYYKLKQKFCIIFSVISTQQVEMLMFDKKGVEIDYGFPPLPEVIQISSDDDDVIEHNSNPDAEPLPTQSNFVSVMNTADWKYKVNIPIEFAKTFLGLNGRLVHIQVPGVRKQFQVQYVTRFSQEGVFKKARFEKGWRAFVQENQLGKDDEVEFTLTVADDYRIEFQTEITRAGQ
ncbi:hypothetical protein GH714_029690 [Hevea brasiliensis]|uniref:TF-B3 domain-containing protein n=1 Tax=Hevea brasiliensis TaxID=3981 RepID=A0A6A6LMT2_HEVBR|nr:hypothetical protein GH714_029690 [Hevea brasiliensis]